MATIKKKVDHRKGPKDSHFVSAQPHEIKRVVRRFASFKTGKHLPESTVYFLQALMRENLGRVKREELEAVLALLGFGRDPQIDER